jgi:hypothetical protein
VDRLGTSRIDRSTFSVKLHAKGVDLFLHQQGLDTSIPSGRAMFQMMGVFNELERTAETLNGTPVTNSAKMDIFDCASWMALPRSRSRTLNLSGRERSCFSR